MADVTDLYMISQATPHVRTMMKAFIDAGDLVGVILVYGNFFLSDVCINQLHRICGYYT